MGTADVGSTIKVDDGNTQIATATTGSTGAWSFDTGTIALGATASPPPPPTSLATPAPPRQPTP
jgi:hypothetical protein